MGSEQEHTERTENLLRRLEVLDNGTEYLLRRLHVLESAYKVRDLFIQRYNHMGFQALFLAIYGACDFDRLKTTIATEIIAQAVSTPTTIKRRDLVMLMYLMKSGESPELGSLDPVVWSEDDVEPS